MPVVPPFLSNYEEPEGPRFDGDFVTAPPEFSGQIKVVSYNIDYGKETDQALEELTRLDTLKRPDILLLQEMDEEGVEKMARSLGCRFVYYPASIHKHGRNFGNAILTPWKIQNDQKLILPHRSPINGQIRISLRAAVIIHSQEVITHCSHTEVYATTRRLRNEQVGAIIDNVGQSATHVIVGGDFNTVTRRAIKRMIDQFGEIGMLRATQGIGATVQKFGFTPSAADHIFTKGMEVIAAGVEKRGKASDHFPIWVTLNPNF